MLDFISADMNIDVYYAGRPKSNNFAKVYFQDGRENLNLGVFLISTYLEYKVICVFVREPDKEIDRSRERERERKRKRKRERERERERKRERERERE